MGYALGLRIWRLGKLSWEASNSPILSSGLGYTCAYGFCWLFVERACYVEDDELGGIWCLSGSLGNRIQSVAVVVVQPAGSSLTCCQWELPKVSTFISFSYLHISCPVGFILFSVSFHILYHFAIVAHVALRLLTFLSRETNKMNSCEIF